MLDIEFKLSRVTEKTTDEGVVIELSFVSRGQDLEDSTCEVSMHSKDYKKFPGWPALNESYGKKCEVKVEPHNKGEKAEPGVCITRVRECRRYAYFKDPKSGLKGERIMKENCIIGLEETKDSGIRNLTFKASLVIPIGIYEEQLPFFSKRDYKFTFIFK